MTEWLRNDFTVNVTQEDIDAPNRGNWWDDPIHRAIMRQFRLTYPVNVTVGWGYLSIDFPTETDKFEFKDMKAGEAFIRAFQNGWIQKPCSFDIKLVQIVNKKEVTSFVTPRRYSKVAPKTTKLGM